MLTSNFTTNDQNPVITIEEATVSLFEGDAFLGDLLHTADGIYRLQTEIAEGKTYTLTATCNGYPTIEATTSVPIAQEFFVCRQWTLHTWTGTNQIAYNVNVVSKIPESQTPSYYGFCFYRASETISENAIDTVYQIYTNIDELDKFVDYFDYSMANIFSVGKIIDFTEIKNEQNLSTYFPENWELSSGSKRSFFLSSEPFLGQEYTINQSLGRLPSIDLVTHVNIYQLSEELYKSFKGIAAQKSTQNSLFVTPVPAYNSIKGGLGYFGATLVHTIKFDESTSSLQISK
jgi:hypothetical protein